MGLLTLIQSPATKPQAEAGRRKEDYLCWSRMQAEAGQQLEAIIERKERERRAGNGLFFWGVGNAPASLIRVLALMSVPVPVVFSVMKTKAKAIDAMPAKTLAWKSYIDATGAQRPLPRGALVTSRGNTTGGAKKRHYALMCHSDMPLRFQRGVPFDPAAYRNVSGNGAPVGASQVTALLRRVDERRNTTNYEANMLARLTGSYWVRLTDPVQLDEATIRAIADFQGDQQTWIRLVEDIWSSTTPGCLAARMQCLLI